MKCSRIEMLMGIFIAIIVMVSTFVMLEILSRKFMPSRSPFEQRFPVEIWRLPRPYCMFSGKPDGEGLNSLGYRGIVPQKQKPQGEFRIFFLGGSTVVEGSPPIAELLQELFNQCGLSSVRIYNFGVVSSVSGMELSKIVFEIADLEPNLVVMYNGGNDMIHPLYWDPRPGYPFNFIAYENNPLLDKKITEYPAFALLSYGSNIIRRCFPSYFLEKFVPLSQERLDSGYLSDEWKAKIADVYLKNLIKANRISRAFGADFIIFYQPLVYFKDTLSKEEKDTLDKAVKPFCEDATGKLFREIRQIIQARATEISQQKDNGLEFVDLSNIYQFSKDWVFSDIIHTRQEAKPVVAQAIFTHLVDRVRNSQEVSQRAAGSGTGR